MRFVRTEQLHISGDNSLRDPPVPIPNTEVKPQHADGTWLATARESRSSPDSIFLDTSKDASFFFYNGIKTLLHRNHFLMQWDWRTMLLKLPNYHLPLPAGICYNISMWNIVIRIGIELAAAFVIALLLRRFVCAFALVRGRSMLDTLQNHELMFVLRFGLFGQPERFDVVICKYPNRKGLFVKRIIALPGETISMEEDVVFINGEAIAESFPRRKCLRKMDERAVGADEYFVMGDNRPGSHDSRRVGPLKRKQILYRVHSVVFPFKRMRKIL